MTLLLLGSFVSGTVMAVDCRSNSQDFILRFRRQHRSFITPRASFKVQSFGGAFYTLSNTITLETKALTLRTGVMPQSAASEPKSCRV